MKRKRLLRLVSDIISTRIGLELRFSAHYVRQIFRRILIIFYRINRGGRTSHGWWWRKGLYSWTATNKNTVVSLSMFLDNFFSNVLDSNSYIWKVHDKEEFITKPKYKDTDRWNECYYPQFRFTGRLARCCFICYRL